MAAKIEEKMEGKQTGYVPEGKIGSLSKEVGVLALYSVLETCNHLKEDKVEVRTLLQPHLIKTQVLIETLVPKQTFLFGPYSFKVRLRLSGRSAMTFSTFPAGLATV